MKRSLLALCLTATLAVLSACSSDTSQSGGSSNPDNQVSQPPLPSSSPY